VLDRRINQITGLIIAAAIKIHKALGPGLLESAYLACMVFELRRGGTRIQVQKKVPVQYEDVKLDCEYKIDIVAEDLVVVELKSVRRLAPIHTAQMLTYLKLTGYPIGLLMNFNVRLLKDGIRRLVNAHPDERFLTRTKRLIRMSVPDSDLN
jgi:GxxExxY protein